MPTLVHQYNWEKYSVLDLKRFVEKKGCKTKKVFYQQILAEKVIDHDIFLEYPKVSDRGVSASFRFINNKKEAKYEESKALFQALMRKFKMSQKEFHINFYSDKIEKLKGKLKDWDKIDLLQWCQPRPHFLNPRRKPYIINLKTGERQLFQKYQTI